VRARARARVALALIFRTSARLRMLIIVFALPCEVCMLYSSGESRARDAQTRITERERRRERKPREIRLVEILNHRRATESSPDENVMHSG